MIGEDTENPWGLKFKSGKLKKLSSLIDSAVFPGTQGGPLEHIIAAKAVAFREAQQPEYKSYIKNVVKNAQLMAEELVNKGYQIISDDKISLPTQQVNNDLVCFVELEPFSFKTFSKGQKEKSKIVNHSNLILENNYVKYEFHKEAYSILEKY